MPDDANAQFAKMLYRAPDFRARGSQFFRDARTADDQRGVVAQQANDVAEAGVGQAFRRRSVGAGWA
jgi:hypothetical protein